MKLTGLKTTIKITGFARAYPHTARMHGLGSSISAPPFTAEPDLTADLEIEIESSDGRKTTHLADLFITPEQECQLMRLLRWAAEQHRRSLLTTDPNHDMMDSPAESGLE